MAGRVTHERRMCAYMLNLSISFLFHVFCARRYKISITINQNYWTERRKKKRREVGKNLKSVWNNIYINYVEIWRVLGDTQRWQWRAMVASSSRSSQQDDCKLEWNIIVAQLRCSQAHLSECVSSVYCVPLNADVRRSCSAWCDCPLMIADDIIYIFFFYSYTYSTSSSVVFQSLRSYFFCSFSGSFPFLRCSLRANIVCCLSWALTPILISTLVTGHFRKRNIVVAGPQQCSAKPFENVCVFTCALHRRQQRFR